MKNLQKSPSDMDEFDLMLVRELEKDARASYAMLASKLNKSPSTVRRRFNRLIDQGSIIVVTVPDYAALGYRTVLVLAIKATHGKVDTLVQQLASIDSIKLLWITTGHYDIMAVALYRTPGEYIDSFQEEFAGIPENVRIDAMLPVRLIKNNWSHLPDVPTVSSQSNVTLTELDLSVMSGLGKSPRVSVKELARDIGASVPSVRYSLHKLLSRGIVRVIVAPDPGGIGDNVNGIILIQVHPSNTKALTAKLKAHPSVRVMTNNIGTFNCMLWVTFQNSDQMSDFLVNDLGNLPGMVCYETLVCLKLSKRDYSILRERIPQALSWKK